MFTHHRLALVNQPDCPHAVGTHTFSSQRAKPFRDILLLSSPAFVYHRHKLPNLRISFRAGAAQLRAASLWICRDAGACSSPAQRTTGKHPGRCLEVTEARSIAAFDWTLPTQTKGRLAWGTGAFLAKAVLRFQYPGSFAVCRKAALYSPQSGETRAMRAARGLGVRTFLPES